MGERGPLKLPPTLRVVAPDEKPEATVHSKVTPARPEKPKGLPAAASAAWDVIVEDLDRAGIIARCDGPTLELALRHYAMAVKASNTLMRASVSQDDKKNQRSMKHPASQVMRDHSTAFLEYAKQLGLTFVSRARTPLPEQEGGEGGNPFA